MLAGLGPANAEVMGFVVSQLEKLFRRDFPAREEDDHRRRAATAHQPASMTSSTISNPAAVSTGRKSGASASSIPEKIAMPPGRVP